MIKEPHRLFEEPARATDQIIIPDKLYFKIGEVCKLTGIKQHVLRYWESEFKIIKPQRASSKQRLYRKSDVENILKIKKLLQEEGFTIAGARKFMSKEKIAGDPKKQDKTPQKQPVTDLYKDIKSELFALKEILEKQ